ncbi:MAG: epimerase, partial [Marinilabiliales bacterium]
SSLENTLRGYDACYFSLGVSAAGMKEKNYRTITYGFTLAAASILRKLNDNMTFIYVSGVGTDSTEKGRSMWARVKGKTENDIIKLGFKDAYMYRPGYIQPEREIKSKTKLYNALYVVTKPLYPILNALIPNQLTTTTKLGKSMINISRKPYTKKIITNRDINIIASNNY